MAFVLKSKDRYFRYMSAIGPVVGSREEAEVFQTREEAASSEAMRHPLAGFEVVEL